MKMRHVGAVLSLVCVAGRATAQSPLKDEGNRRMIEKEATGILTMAHPTVTRTWATHFLRAIFMPRCERMQALIGL